MARDAPPHWLRVSFASLWKGGKLWRLWEKRREVCGGDLFTIVSALGNGHGPSLLLGRAEYITIYAVESWLFV